MNAPEFPHIMTPWGRASWMTVNTIEGWSSYLTVDSQGESTLYKGFSFAIAIISTFKGNKKISIKVWAGPLGDIGRSRERLLEVVTVQKVMSVLQQALLDVNEVSPIEQIVGDSLFYAITDE